VGSGSASTAADGLQMSGLADRRLRVADLPGEVTTEERSPA